MTVSAVNHMGGDKQVVPNQDCWKSLIRSDSAGFSRCYEDIIRLALRKKALHGSRIAAIRFTEKKIAITLLPQLSNNGGPYERGCPRDVDLVCSFHGFLRNRHWRFKSREHPLVAGPILR